MQKLNLEMAARNDAKTDRDPYDFYATDPKTVEKLLDQLEKDHIKLCNDSVWECAAGNGHISEVLINNGYNVYSTDIINREYPLDGVYNFLTLKEKPYKNTDTIITNPPYKDALRFILKALEIMAQGDLIIFYLKDRFLEGRARYENLFKQYPPRYVYCHVDRQNVAMRGDFKTYCQNSNSQFYIWCIWQKGYTGETVLRWIGG